MFISLGFKCNQNPTHFLFNTSVTLHWREVQNVTKFTHQAVLKEKKSIPDMVSPFSFFLFKLNSLSLNLCSVIFINLRNISPHFVVKALTTSLFQIFYFSQIYPKIPLLNLSVENFSKGWANLLSTMLCY